MRLVVVSYRLPFRVVRGRLVQNAGGLVSAMLAYASAKDGAGAEIDELVWIGVSDDSAEDLAKARRTSQEAKFTLIPITIPEKVDQLFYGGFCNDLIWPLFHYFPSISNFEEKSWQAYRQANEIFRDVVCGMTQPTDRIWIHDYHFMLLPAMIREMIPAARLGFFLHIPFPSFEVVRQMPRAWLAGMLQGMLGADLLGFHTYDYVQHFANSVARTIGLQIQGGWIQGGVIAARVEAFPIGIDAKSFRAEMDSRRTDRERKKIQEAMGDRIMMFSVDRMDYSKGLLNRLEGFDLFFKEHPEWKEKITFNMVVIPSRDSIVRYQKLRKELEAFIGHMNGLYGTLNWRPIAYQYKTLTRSEMVALYDVADIGLITPMRDGMNLVAKEFVACQPDVHPGILILSEMAGAASELREALLINPNDRREIADAIFKALQMTEEERFERWSRLRDRVFSYDVFTWAQDFLQTLDVASDSTVNSRAESLGEAALTRLKTAFATAQVRSVFLDYDGTLVPFQKEPQAAVPSPQVIEILSKLCADSRTQVSIISGRDRAFLEKWFGMLPVCLVAEHGAFVKRIGEEWETVWEAPPDWGLAIRKHMQRACRRCLGAAIEEKSTAIVWHYRNAEPIQGLRVAQELEEELTGLLGTEQYRVVPGNRIVEVRPSGFDKGQAARALLASRPSSFVMAIGDDRTDEDLFAVLPKGAYAIKVGQGATKAKYHLREASEVLRLLGGLLLGAS